ncbi:ral guanine nucleotide dissociation stimulator-like [Lutra lutra]|uniref:ral guanine nucleotide dissociation stimulator-like n=1 Tax=Lutra lutra TaxID=9657 RepID=UPI001FD3B616|nr:ral guanine nucleotide dissociation stimulator-like [Lutra lutra]
MPPWEHHLERPPGHGMIWELFKKVVPHQCLGSVWSRRNRPGNEHLAPTVRATIAQFNAVASCIVTTCLGNPSMTARDRAVVVDHWIRVAKACQILGNYSSLHAILAALQSVPIHRLKRTWGNVSRKTFQTYKKLCREDNPQGRELLIKERPSSKLATLARQLQRAWKGLPKKGVVPYLGTFLTDLVMLDTAMEDYLEGNEINHGKKNKEYRVLTDIMLLQAAAENYCLEPQHPFTAWFWAVERLSEDDSYILSCRLEPRS